MKNGIFLRSLFPLLAFLFAGCSMLERSPESGYNDRLSSGPVRRVQSDGSSGEVHRVETKTRLKQLENSIQTKKEVEQYSRVLPYLKDEHERIYFLSLPGYEARQQWMKDQDINTRTQLATDTYRDLIDTQDIGLGMTQNLVRKSWGEPEAVDVSGNPQFRNERWKYNRYVSTPDGYKVEKKFVYFEGGRVVGWEVE